MSPSRYSTWVYALVLVALTASTCTFFYALSMVWNGRTPARPSHDTSHISARDAKRSQPQPWAMIEDFEISSPVSLPDEFDPPELFLPNEGDQVRFALRHPGVNASSSRLPIFEVILGGPGMYPPVRLISDEAGEFSTSLDVADMLNGERVESLEVFVRERARGRDSALGLWRTVDLPELEQGSCVNGFMCLIIPLWDVVPMRVKIRNLSGERVVNARVKLSLDSVGLVHIKEQVNSGGDVFFGGIPEGRYTLSIKAPGYLMEEIEIIHALVEGGVELNDAEGEIVYHEVMLEEGRSLYGRVVDEQGRGVVDAFVTVYVDRYGSPDVLSVESFTRIDSIPIRGVATTAEDGYFSISGLPKGVAYVTAMGTLGVPALSLPLDLREVPELGPVEVVLHDGSDVEVFVTGPDGPVGGVTVSWRDASTGLRSSFVTASDGVAIFEDVPPRAIFAAELKHWSATSRGLEAPDEDGVYRLELRLEPPGVREEIRLRLLSPVTHPVEVVSLSFRGEKQGELCDGKRIAPRDWMFTQCSAQQGWLEVQTAAHGTWSALIMLDHGEIVTMPAPLVVNVFWRHWKTPPEVMQIEDVVGERTQSVPLIILDRRAVHRTWSGHLYPGRYELEVSAEGESYRETFSVEEGSRSLEWEAPFDSTLRVDLVDDREHPLHSSYFAVIRDGVHVDVRRDNASHMVPLSRRDINHVTLLACGRISGCVTHRIVEEDLNRSRMVLRTSGSALTGAASLQAITDVARIEQLLGATLVQDNLRWLVDVKDAQSMAARHGIPRGASLVFIATRQEKKGERIEALLLLPDESWKFVSGVKEVP